MAKFYRQPLAFSKVHLLPTVAFNVIMIFGHNTFQSAYSLLAIHNYNYVSWDALFNFWPFGSRIKCLV